MPDIEITEECRALIAAEFPFEQIGRCLPNGNWQMPVDAETWTRLHNKLQKLQGVLDGSGIDDHAYAETLGLLLLWELRHAADLKHSRLSQVRGGLTVRQLRRGEGIY